MIKKAKVTKKVNVDNFPIKINDLDKEIEAVIFAAAEPLDVDTIESKIYNSRKKQSACKIDFI